MTRIERALLALLGLAFAFVLVVVLHGCGGTADTPGHLQPLGCRCYATAELTFDGGLCTRPGALCSRVCTCETVPPCTVQTSGICVGGELYEVYAR